MQHLRSCMTTSSTTTRWVPIHRTGKALLHDTGTTKETQWKLSCYVLLTKEDQTWYGFQYIYASRLRTPKLPIEILFRYDVTALVLLIHWSPFFVYIIIDVVSILAQTCFSIEYECTILNHMVVHNFYIFHRANAQIGIAQFWIAHSCSFSIANAHTSIAYSCMTHKFFLLVGRLSVCCFLHLFLRITINNSLQSPILKGVLKLRIGIRWCTLYMETQFSQSNAINYHTKLFFHVLENPRNQLIKVHGSPIHRIPSSHHINAFSHVFHIPNVLFHA